MKNIWENFVAATYFLLTAIQSGSNLRKDKSPQESASCDMKNFSTKILSTTRLNFVNAVGRTNSN